MTAWSDFFDASSESLGRVLADVARDFVCLATAHGEPIYMNAAGRRLIGLAAAQDLGIIALRDYYAESSWVELRDTAVPAVNRRGHWEGRSQLRHSVSGDLIDVRTMMLRVRSADLKSTCLAIVHYVVDETARLKAALAETQSRKNAILESCLDPIITINHEGVITEFNRAAEQIFGHARQKVLGTKPSDLLFPPSTSPDQQNRIDRYLTRGEGSLLGRRTEVVAMRANGETFDAEIAMTLSHEQGEPVMTFFVRDISRRKRAELEQARYAAELERSNRELEQFAYVASHDLQEPLRKIRSFGERLQQSCADKLDELGCDCLGRMLSAAERMQVLTDGLLRLSRVTTERQQFVAVDLQQVANEVVSDLEINIEQVKGRVKVGPLPTIEADPLQMRQLLQNLISNGLKFHRADESPVVIISGEVIQGRSYRAPRSAARERLCRIVVADNGIGFEEKHQETIFGLFQRLHSRDEYAGTGIGLALCRKIVERHGGQITTRSVPGKGSAFEVLLPVAQAAAS